MAVKVSSMFRSARLVFHCLRGAIGAAVLCAVTLVAEPTAWFVDGYHGGIYGHYPASFTRFMVDTMNANPRWKLNLEIEPATWDFARTNTPEAYAAFKKLAEDQSVSGRIEFINPAYGQSYFWNCSGESLIQQLDRGMEIIREHFPNAKFVTYSSEEPCFTSALPGILKSFGFKQAVLKNPNTCWGGYVRAFGGELVNWIGPDGTAIPTVPRYEMESLKPGSTWETIANVTNPEFVHAALNAGIEHPVGMCLQDAGWRNGPWLKDDGGVYRPFEFTTWRNYFENAAVQKTSQDWHFSQEDVRVSLVWGAQVLQRVAQEVRRAENKLATAEKMATLAAVDRQAKWPEASVNDAWRTLMLSQHHDCWIVPYNVRHGRTWAEQVSAWTENTVQLSDEIIRQSAKSLCGEPATNDAPSLRVFNTLAVGRINIVSAPLPESRRGEVVVRDRAGKEVPSQLVKTDAGTELIFSAAVPALGYADFQIGKSNQTARVESSIETKTNESAVLETDLYRMELDLVHGGTIRSLVLKTQGNRELVDVTNERRFNELRGYFFKEGKFISTADRPARVEIVEKGPVRFRVRIHAQLHSNPVTQTITLTHGQRRIDFSARIDWKEIPGIGEDYQQVSGFSFTNNHKAFYDDRWKLLALFPLKLKRQEIFKNAPFDVTRSQLTNTFFNAWSEIKNNVLLNWVDVFDPDAELGLALLSDHTTSYAYGADHPLGLTIQYSGIGLWGRNYTVDGPTEVHYALVPHAGDWEQASIWNESDAWNEPLQVEFSKPEPVAAVGGRSLLSFDQNGWEVPAMRLKNGKVYVRLFNPSGRSAQRKLTYRGPAAKIEWVSLNDELLREIPTTKDPTGNVLFDLSLPRFGIGTLRITP